MTSVIRVEDKQPFASLYKRVLKVVKKKAAIVINKHSDHNSRIQVEG